MRLVTLSFPRDKPHERLRSKRVQQIIVLNRATLIFQKSKLLLQGNLFKLI